MCFHVISITGNDLKLWLLIQLPPGTIDTYSEFLETVNNTIDFGIGRYFIFIFTGFYDFIQTISYTNVHN